MHKTTHFHQTGLRPYQEDAFYIDPEHRYFVVCDGMGGATHGALASDIVSESIKDRVGRFGVPGDQNEAKELLEWVWRDFMEVYRQHPETDGMGTTLVVAFAVEEGILVAHVGDSRAYHIRQEEGLLWRTRDHSEVQELYDAGIIPSVEAMERHPRRNVITRAFIAREDVDMPEADYHRIRNIRPDDILMLCTDGVLEPFSQDSQVEILADPGLSLKEKTEMIRRKCAEASKDNNTAVFVEWIGKL